MQQPSASSGVWIPGTGKGLKWHGGGWGWGWGPSGLTAGGQVRGPRRSQAHRRSLGSLPAPARSAVSPRAGSRRAQALDAAAWSHAWSLGTRRDPDL